MELYKALKTVIDLQGPDILKDQRLINILSDFKAYEEAPAAKFILKSMINEGLIAKLQIEYSSSDITTLISSNRISLSDNYGFKENIADYVVRCLAYAQGWINDIPSFELVSFEDSNGSKNSNNIEPVADDGKHLLFKQFPITGDVNSLIQALSSSGYKLEEPYSYTYHAAALSGPFAGHNDCTVLVSGTPKTNIACAVLVYLQQHNIWYSIKNQYEEIKEQLTKKYGAPKSYEYFSDPYYEGDSYELQALGNDHCTWMSHFNTSKGTISVSMSNNCKVLIIYQTCWLN